MALRRLAASLLGKEEAAARERATSGSPREKWPALGWARLGRASRLRRASARALGRGGFSASQSSAEAGFWRARRQARAARESQLFPRAALAGAARPEASSRPPQVTERAAPARPACTRRSCAWRRHGASARFCAQSGCGRPPPALVALARAAARGPPRAGRLCSRPGGWRPGVVALRAQRLQLLQAASESAAQGAKGALAAPPRLERRGGSWRPRKAWPPAQALLRRDFWRLAAAPPWRGSRCPPPRLSGGPRAAPRGARELRARAGRRNLACANLSSQRAARQRLLLEELGLAARCRRRAPPPSLARLLGGGEPAPARQR